MTHQRQKKIVLINPNTKHKPGTRSRSNHGKPCHEPAPIMNDQSATDKLAARTRLYPRGSEDTLRCPLPFRKYSIRSIVVSWVRALVSVPYTWAIYFPGQFFHCKCPHWRRIAEIWRRMTRDGSRAPRMPTMTAITSSIVLALAMMTKDRRRGMPL